MELRHIRYFVVLTEEMNFTRAAARLNIAQPALSIQIKNLEGEIGAELVSREGREIRLTAAGRVFLEKAKQILAIADRTVSLTRQAAKGEIGDLAIGHNGLAELLLFPRIVPAFKKKFPGVHLTFHNLRTPHLVEKLRRDELDIGFVWLPVSADEFDIARVMDVPLIVVLPERHPLADKDIIAIEDLAETPLVLLSRGRDLGSFHQIEELFLNAGVPMNVAHEFDQLLSIINFVGMGEGCSILPKYERRILEGVVYRPLQPPNIVKQLAIIKKKRTEPLAEAFYEFAISEIPCT